MIYTGPKIHYRHPRFHDQAMCRCAIAVRPLLFTERRQEVTCKGCVRSYRRELKRWRKALDKKRILRERRKAIEEAVAVRHVEKRTSMAMPALEVPPALYLNYRRMMLARASMLPRAVRHQVIPHEVLRRYPIIEKWRGRPFCLREKCRNRACPTHPWRFDQEFADALGIHTIRYDGSLVCGRYQPPEEGENE